MKTQIKHIFYFIISITLAVIISKAFLINIHHCVHEFGHMALGFLGNVLYGHSLVPYPPSDAWYYGSIIPYPTGVTNLIHDEQFIGLVGGPLFAIAYISLISTYSCLLLKQLTTKHFERKIIRVIWAIIIGISIFQQIVVNVLFGTDNLLGLKLSKLDYPTLATFADKPLSYIVLALFSIIVGLIIFLNVTKLKRFNHVDERIKYKLVLS